MIIRLRKGAWHARLQDAMFGPLPTFENFCPYFWLTVFCVMASPFFFAWRAVRWVVPAAFRVVLMVVGPVANLYVAVFERLIDLIDASVCSPIEAVTLAGVDDATLLSYYRYSRDYYVAKGYGEERAMEELLSRDGGSRFTRRWAARMDAKFQVWKRSAGDSWAAVIEEARGRERVREEEVRRAAAARRSLCAGVRSFVGFVGDGVAMFKKDHCPGIEWE